MPLSADKLYECLLSHFGLQHWWPVDEHYHKKNHSDPRFEVMIGAILTQNTAWSNVEKALLLLKNKNALTIQQIAQLDENTLKTLIQPSGFFNQKAKRLKNLALFLQKNYDSDINVFFRRNIQEIRQELLSLHGIGPETADSIILYAGDLPIFVVDAYTKRLVERLPLSVEEKTYEGTQKYFQENLQKIYPAKDLVPIYKQFHALIVENAKNYCKKNPRCQKCPVNICCASFELFQ
ncbi:MAG: endonuclease [Euryarchaeota archaeon]|nr:endonuclease [Euryarchaeota archaeon]